MVGQNVQMIQQALMNCEISDYAQVAKVLELNEFMAPTVDHPALTVDFKTNLVKQSESDYQKSEIFKETFISCGSGAIDNSSTSAFGPFYMPAQEIPNVGSAIYHKRSKHDVTSAVAPMDLEMKSDVRNYDTPAGIDWECLKQAQDRVKVRMHLHHFLRYSLAFAVTNRTAWCCVAVRQMGETIIERHQVAFHTYRISHSAVAPLWMGVTRKAADQPLFFLTEDGPHLWQSLTKIGATPWACRVKLLASSQSNVYAVTMPSKDNSVLCINADQSAITYAVKIVHEDNDFEREVDALTAISGCDPELYAVGHVHHSANNAQLLILDEEWQLGETVTNNEREEASNLWWLSLETETNVNTGGAIFMKYGLPWNGKDNVKEVCDGVATSLRMAHAARVLHCDIRSSNVLRFGCGWRLIDFGLSWPVGSNDKYDLDSASGSQAKGAGPRVRELLRRKDDIFWEIGDDYEMLLQMIGCFPA